VAPKKRLVAQNVRQKLAILVVVDAMMRGHLPDLEPEVIQTDGLCEFDRSLFGAEALSTEAVQTLGRTVAAKVAAKL